MKIKVLGAHNTESRRTRFMSILVDDILALDAGGITSSLAFRDQLKIKALLITHGHYDHIRDVPSLAMNFYLREKTIALYTHQAVSANLTRYFLNGDLYPEFQKKPLSEPTLKINLLTANQKVNIEGYQVLPIPVNHAIPAMGYSITSVDGKSIFYSGDTGAGLSEIWDKVSPQALFLELTTSNRWEESVKSSGHLTPNLLQKELAKFRLIKGYWPQIIAVHINPTVEREIAREILGVNQSLGTHIQMGHEGMLIEI
jgi:ribonuclease BN (tRNA processing enzyme)